MLFTNNQMLKQYDSKLEVKLGLIVFFKASTN